MAVKAYENSKYTKVNKKILTMRPEVKNKIDRFEDLTKEEYETMTYVNGFIFGMVLQLKIIYLVKWVVIML